MSLKRSSNNLRDTKKIKKILNEEVRLGINTLSDSETEDVDIHKELFPLSHYINNREEMIEQMFSIIKGVKLKKMLPHILKDVPLDELKADCLIHLLGMSTKRIQAVLEGREIDSSSDSETHSDSSVSPSKTSMMNLKPIVIKQEGCSDISDNSEEVVLVDPDWVEESATRKRTKETHQGHGNSKERHNAKRKAKNLEEKSKQIKKGSTQESVTQPNTEQNEHQSLESSSDNENNEEVAVAPTGGKTLLEILELEMRARAIRALLQKDNTPDGQGSKNATENASQSTTNPEDKLVKPSKKTKSGSEKVTPVRNFRKKKRKSDDVIVIAPKVVTIDLTDENDTSYVKHKQMVVQRNDIKIGSLLSDNQDYSVEKAKDLCKSSQIILNNEESSNHTDSKSVAESDVSKRQVAESKPISSTHSPEGIAIQLDSEKSKKADQLKTNWAQRWLESKEVKKVVSTSKICGNIRKRIKSAKLAKQIQGNTLKGVTESKEVQGSVGEYQLLTKSSKVLDSVAVIPNTDTLEENTTLLPNKDILIELNSRETSSIEQVQDVTSTKNEIPLETSSQNHTVCESKIDEKEYFTNSKIESSQSHVSKLLPSETSSHELQVNYSENSIIKTSEIEQFVTYFTPEDSETIQVLDTDLKAKTCESIHTNIVSVNLSEGDVKKSDTKLGESQPSIDVLEVNKSNKNIETNIHGFKNHSSKVKLLESETSKNCITNVKSELSSSCNVTSSKLDISDSQLSKTDVISISSSKMCDLNPNESESLKTNFSELVITTSYTKLAENNYPTEEVLEPSNEPETLEINITDEDLEIDG